MVSDRVGDFIVRLQNAGAVGKANVALPYSAHLEAIAKKLQTLGFVSNVDVSGASTKKMLEVALAYDDRGAHKIHGVKRISKPGRRLYVPAREAHSIKEGTGARILSTPRGILSDKEARKVRAGGEDLFQIW
jgi:small subunit ribosomal protein S8